MKKDRFQLTVELEVEDVFNPFWVNHQITDALANQQGERTADLVLKSLTEKISHGFFGHNYKQVGSPVYHLIRVIESYVKPEHAKQVAKILLTDEVALDGDRSNKNRLVSILGEVGDEEVIPHLVQYARKTLDSFVPDDRQQARRAIEEILTRVFPSRPTDC